MKKTRILILGIIIGLAISTIVGVYATNTFNSRDISYTNKSTNVDNVQDAVDELYSKYDKYKNIYYLSDVAEVGDYVAYDAGSWTETVDRPTSQGEFGGYTKGQNKANSATECQSGWGSTTLKGWRVFSIDTNTKTVVLIHAGQPECYYHGTDQSASITNLNNRANIYLNSDYANLAHMMNKEDADQNVLKITGTYYWLQNTGGNALWCVENGGGYNLYGGYSFGIRPIIVLKPNILTAGKGVDYVGQEAWTLVKP